MRAAGKFPLAALAFFIVAGARCPRADPILPEHRICARDADCVAIPVACACPCGAPVDAANRRFVENYRYLTACTDSQRLECGAVSCAGSAPPVAVCRAGRCEIKPKTGGP